MTLHAALCMPRPWHIGQKQDFLSNHRCPLATALGIEFTHFNPQSIGAKMRVDSSITDEFGFDGNALMLILADHVIGAGGFVNVDVTQCRAVTSGLSINCFESVRQGTFVARAVRRELRARAQQWIVDVEQCTHSAKKLVCTAHGSVAIVTREGGVQFSENETAPMQRRAIAFSSGLELADDGAEIGTIDASFPISADQINELGVLHGGVLAWIAYQMTLFGSKRRIVGRQLRLTTFTIDFMRAVFRDEIVSGEARLIYRGRNKLVWYVELMSRERIVGGVFCTFAVGDNECGR